MSNLWWLSWETLIQSAEVNKQRRQKCLFQGWIWSEAEKSRSDCNRMQLQQLTNQTLKTISSKWSDIFCIFNIWDLELSLQTLPQVIHWNHLRFDVLVLEVYCFLNERPTVLEAVLVMEASPGGVQGQTEWKHSCGHSLLRWARPLRWRPDHPSTRGYKALISCRLLYLISGHMFSAQSQQLCRKQLASPCPRPLFVQMVQAFICI